MSRFKSRKFIISIITVISGLCGIFLKEGAGELIGGVLMALVPTVIYVVTEGRLDEKALRMALEGVAEVIADENNTNAAVTK